MKTREEKMSNPSFSPAYRTKVKNSIESASVLYGDLRPAQKRAIKYFASPLSTFVGDNDTKKLVQTGNVTKIVEVNNEPAV